MKRMRQKNDGKLTIAQRAGVKGLGQVQSGLKEETAELIENLEGAPVFALTLRRASKSMEDSRQAARRDQDRQDRPSKPPRPPPIDSSSSSNRSRPMRRPVKVAVAAVEAVAAAVAANGGNGDGIPATAQLKMLKSLQQEINERTEALDELQRRNQKLTPEQTAELKRLGEEQGTLADLVRDMTRPKRDDGEE